MKVKSDSYRPAGAAYTWRLVEPAPPQRLVQGAEGLGVAVPGPVVLQRRHPEDPLAGGLEEADLEGASMN